MSEDKGELNKTLPSKLSSPSDTSTNRSTPLSSIEERLVNANSPEEITLWTRVRGEIIRQNELVKDSKHWRSLEKIQVIRQTSLYVVAITTAVGFILGGLTVPGLLILGVIFYEIAPDYFLNNLSKQNKFRENEDS